VLENVERVAGSCVEFFMLLSIEFIVLCTVGLTVKLITKQIGDLFCT
jgi:hypothetical protein